MSMTGPSTQEASTGGVSFWGRIPVIIRATIIGAVVSSIGVYAWVFIVALVPAPWSVFIMGILLCVYVAYFRGRWWPESTAQARKIRFRDVWLPAGMWKWGLLSALSLIAIWQAGLVVTFRFVEFPGEVITAGYDLTGIPLWVAWLMVVMSSLVAGICEETGYRGYMQQPIETRYGPVIAIGLVSALFLIIHLPQVWAPPLLLHLFALSALLGVLAYASGSLIPGILAHFALDIFNFSYWWTDLAGRYDQRPIAETGIDAHFIIWGIVLLAAVSLFVLGIYKLMRPRN
jgi:membrane protease YdiL (CAAX protease family)